MPAGLKEATPVEVEDAEIVMHFAHAPGAIREIRPRFVKERQHSHKPTLDLVEPASRPVRQHRPREAFGEARLIEYPLSFVDSDRLFAVSDGLGMVPLQALGDRTPRQV